MKHISIARAVPKTSQKTFFPEALVFISVQDFETYKFRKDKFDFVIDLSETVAGLIAGIEANKKDLLVLQASVNTTSHEIKEKLLQAFYLVFQEIEKKLSILENDCIDLTKQTNRLEEQKGAANIKLEKEIAQLHCGNTKKEEWSTIQDHEREERKL